MLACLAFISKRIYVLCCHFLHAINGVFKLVAICIYIKKKLIFRASKKVIFLCNISSHTKSKIFYRYSTLKDTMYFNFFLVFGSVFEIGRLTSQLPTRGSCHLIVYRLPVLQPSISLANSVQQ